MLKSWMYSGVLGLHYNYLAEAGHSCTVWSSAAVKSWFSAILFFESGCVVDASEGYVVIQFFRWMLEHALTAGVWTT